MSAAAKGKLYLVPAPLDFGCDVQAPLQDVMPLQTLQIASQLSCWICENAKSTRAYLKRIDALHPLSAPCSRSKSRNCRARFTRKATTQATSTRGLC
jgi:16S rRNA (cytidine1402-2'-O)-methyltransferase